MAWYYWLAPINSVLNTIAAILLLVGFYCIRLGLIRLHRALMLSAFGVSVTFFVSYCVYHYQVGDVRFQGRGWVRPAYFTILASHVFLAAAIVPLVLITLWRALSGNFQRHRRIAIWTWPLWIYVSVTGVVVYLMCYQLYRPGYSTPAALTQVSRSPSLSFPRVAAARGIPASGEQRRPGILHARQPHARE
jgi:uncharacterized membrane protein YozB (DUF420 family)